MNAIMIYRTFHARTAQPVGAPSARRLVVFMLVAAFAATLMPDRLDADVRVCTYNILQYSSSQFASRDPNLRFVLAGVNPDIIIIQEISNTNAGENFRNNVLNAPGGPGNGNPFQMGTFTDTASPLDNAIFFRSSLYTEITASYQVIVTPAASRNAYRWRLRPLVETSGNSDIYLYSMHLAAGGESALRAVQAADVRADGNTLPAGTMFIYGGDFNINNSNEGAYQRFIESQAINNGRAWDPLNPNRVFQNWFNNPSFALFHTQSPYNDNPGAPAGAVGGGMDDRYDFLLISESLHDGAGQDYIPGTYRTYGNDGLHFDNDINDPPVIPEGADMANALHASSDHLPVILDLTDPLSNPIITTPSLVGFPQVLTGTHVQAVINVSNTATPPGIPLQYSFSPPVGFLAPGGSFQLNPGNNANHTLTLVNTATSGTRSGTLAITNNSAVNPRNVTLIGIVLDHAVPSVLPDAILTTTLLDFGEVETDDTTQQIATIYNANVPQFPSRVNLAIDTGEITDDAENRFSLVSFNPPIVGISNSTAVTVEFDATGAAPGLYTATLTFETRDDTTVLGATALADIVFALQAVVPGQPGPIRGDFDDNLIVDLDDVAPFVAVLLDPENATEDHLYRADMNEDEVVDALDLQPFVDAILN